MNNPHWLDVAKLPGTAGREDRQYGWQNLFGHFLQHKTILDVGAGLGHSRARLAAGHNNVTLQDIGPNLPVDITTDVTFIPTDSYQVVTAFDVLEHVQADREFMTELLRIASELVIITTPNYLVSRCTNPYHCREYTPSQLLELVPRDAIGLVMTGCNMIHRLYSVAAFPVHHEPSQAIIIDTTVIKQAGKTPPTVQ